MDYEYLPGDKELFDMLDRKTPTDRMTVGMVVPVRRAQELEKLEQLMKRIQAMKSVVGYSLAAAIFFTASIQGWMELTFGFIVTLAAAARAAWLFWKCRHSS